MKTSMNYLWALAVMFFVAVGCKSGPENDATSMEFKGFTNPLIFEADNMEASFTNRYFLYYFDKSGELAIDYVSEPDFMASHGAHPLEKNIGSKELSTALHADRVKDKVVEASIHYTPSWTCDTLNTVQVYGLDVAFSDAKGKKTIDIDRPLNLKQLIQDMYNLSAQDQDGKNNCKGLSEFKSNSKAVDLKIQLQISAKVTTKSGDQKTRNATFFFRGIVPTETPAEE